MRTLNCIGPVTVVAVAVICCPGSAMESDPQQMRPPRIPALEWEERSDWLNVRRHGAAGDDRADDTEALQAAFDTVRNGSTVYLPAGTYRVTRTVTLRGPLVGVLVVGHGRNTTLAWDGEEGGRLFTDDGVAYSRFVGVVFDGRGRAAVGFYHHSMNRFETEVRHQHLAFRDFTDAGILAAGGDKFALAETMFDNCLFERCRRGVAFISFNDYNFTFDGCEFRHCGTGIECRHGNFYARNCHFEQSRVVDVLAQPEHACSVRRCTSVGSRRFVEFANSVSPMTIQDCRVAGWADAEGCVTLNGAPVLLFDCGFSDAPGPHPPVNVRGGRQRLILSQNTPGQRADLVQSPDSALLYEIPPGQRRGTLTSAHQRFLKSTARIPRRIFDATRDFGAKCDGRTDDTVPIQHCIDAARKHGQDAIAYLPTGRYVITDTLTVTGRDYFVGGSGFRTSLVWRGGEGGTIVSVRAPQHVTLQSIAVGNHDSGRMDNAIDILQPGSDGPSHMTYDWVFVYGMYQREPFRQGLVCTNLGAEETVLMPHVQGNLRFTDCAQATILAGTSFEGSVVVDGRDRRRDGFLGFQTRLATLVTHGLYLRDNHSIVMSDFYVEQANNGYVFEGRSDTPPGRATIQGAKLHFTVGKDETAEGTAMTIRDYAGQIFFGPNQFYVEPQAVRISHSGGQSLELFLLGNMFYRTHLAVSNEDAFRLHLLGNHAVGVVSATGEVSAASVEPNDRAGPAVVPQISRALDDLRRLGELDLRLNHGLP